MCKKEKRKQKNYDTLSLESFKLKLSLFLETPFFIFRSLFCKRKLRTGFGLMREVNSLIVLSVFDGLVVK